jgi:hypothetical protein
MPSQPRQDPPSLFKKQGKQGAPIANQEAVCDAVMHEATYERCRSAVPAQRRLNVTGRQHAGQGGETADWRARCREVQATADSCRESAGMEVRRALRSD